MTPNRRNYGSITERQRQLLVVLKELQHRTGLAPTLDELAVEMGVTKGTTHYLVRMAKGKGYLTSTDGKYRSLRLTESGMSALHSGPSEDAA